MTTLNPEVRAAFGKLASRMENATGCFSVCSRHRLEVPEFASGKFVRVIHGAVCFDSTCILFTGRSRFEAAFGQRTL